MTSLPENSRASDPQFQEPYDQETEINLFDIVSVFFRYKRLIAVFTGAAALLSIIYALMQPNIYTAKTMILPSQDDKGMMSSMMSQLGGLAAMAGAGAIGGTNTADLYITLMKSDALKDPLIDRFKLMEHYKSKLRSDLSRSLDKTAVISSGKKDGVITVSFSDKDPKFAAELANAYVEELGRLVVRFNISGAGKNRAFLEERLVGAKADLAKAEEQMKSFQSSNKALNVPEQAKASIQGIATLSAELVANEVKLNTLRRTYTESSQEVKNMAAAVQQLRSQIARLEGSGKGGSIPSLGAASGLGQEYLRLMREFKIQESLVELLTKQYEMARISEAKDVTPFQIIEKAKVPERKSKPARSKIVVLATVTGFFFSVLLAFVLESFSRMNEEDRGKWRGLLRKC